MESNLSHSSESNPGRYDFPGKNSATSYDLPKSNNSATSYDLPKNNNSATSYDLPAGSNSATKYDLSGNSVEKVSL
ncbi:hypothetical protein RclHR1_09090001 [Rhizophagus clarus]|uniref:Uncharacterized protein n=1 Tax=Rhizophagus clarus TaxID=94130 RepID=A0A2Z6S9B9_9GLOM|nr:hypothetical protein RclHR1_09090001 [Rhizophagus clarus]GES95379.1 hypothetical protein RCL_jg9681.t1 [Rhizophagus clarus]